MQEREREGETQERDNGGEIETRGRKKGITPEIGIYLISQACDSVGYIVGKLFGKR
jgi:CDP-diglyceride synthetase